MIKRIVYTDIQAVGYGRIAELTPDVQVQMVDPDLGPIATDEVHALMLQHEDGASVFILTDAVKKNLIRVLSGVEVASGLDLTRALAERGGM